MNKIILQCIPLNRILVRRYSLLEQERIKQSRKIFLIFMGFNGNESALCE